MRAPAPSITSDASGAANFVFHPEIVVGRGDFSREWTSSYHPADVDSPYNVMGFRSGIGAPDVVAQQPSENLTVWCKMMARADDQSRTVLNKSVIFHHACTVAERYRTIRLAH
jgi:hypothetical protein